MPAYKDKKNNTWYSKFRYKKSNGEIKYKTKRGFPTKQSAVIFENDFKKQQSDDMEMKFEDFIEIYRNDIIPRTRLSTLYVRDNIIETKILPYFKDYKTSSIKAKDIMAWQNELLIQNNHKTGSPLSPTYLKKINSTVDTIRKLIVKDEKKELKEKLSAENSPETHRP